MDKSKQATILLLIGALFGGMTFVFVKEGISIVGVYTFLSYRFLIAAAVLGIIFSKRFRALAFEDIRTGLILSVPLILLYITQTIGLQYTSASTAAFITGLSVVLVPLFLCIKQMKLPGKNQVAAVILACAGLGLLTISRSMQLNIGDLWVLSCAFFFAMYIIMVEAYTQHHDAVLVTFVQLFAVGVVTGIIAIFFEGFSIPQGYLAWQAIIFCSVFATSFVYVIQNHYQKYVSATKAAIIFSFEPLFGALTAYMYLQEDLTVRTLGGGLLIFLGMICSEWNVNA